MESENHVFRHRRRSRLVLHKEIIFKTYENHIPEETPRSGEFRCPTCFTYCLLGKAGKIGKHYLAPKNPLT